MTASKLTIHKGAAAAAAVLLLATGAATSYLLTRSRREGGTQMSSATTSATAPMPSTTQAGAAATAATSAPLPDVIVPLAPEALERAGIVLAPVSTGRSLADIRLPGRVEANAYRQVVVTPLVSGRVVRVSAELGTHVRRGQRLAEVYSPELAEAQTKYVSAKAMLDAHDRELQRTEKLVEIGAASRQELERIHAEHAAQTAAVHSARSQLELLGVAIDTLASGSTADSTTGVSAPIDGIVTERAVNVGANVDSATKLFTVVDLSTVWIVADVYEKESARIRVGSDTTITTAAYPGVSLRGTVSYIDPQVNPETRTAKVRVEVPNPRGELRLGMYADVVATAAAGGSMPVVPRGAIQNIGDRTVVYLANPKESGTFTEREVRLGQTSGQQVVVESGVQAGDVIVIDGSFYVRAERERLGLRPASPTDSVGATPIGAAAPTSVQSAKIVVNEQGFDPATVVVRAGAPARFTFLRTTDKTCATEVVFPSLNLKQALPLNQPVEIEFVPGKAGEITFVCGMNMLKGVVVVE